MKNATSNRQCALINLVGGLTFGYSCAGISGALTKIFPALLNIDPRVGDPWKLSLIIASVNFGGLIGSAVVPCASQRLHPCSMISLGCVFNICAFLGMVSPSFALHFVARLLTGVGVGVICTVCPAYVAEVSPPKYRGALSGLFQVSIALGILIASIVSHFVMGKERDMSASELYHTLSTSESMHEALILKTRLLLFPSILIPIVLQACTHPRPTLPKRCGISSIVNHSSCCVVDIEERRVFIVYHLNFIIQYRKSLLIAFACVVALQLTGINAVWFYIFKILDTPGINHQSIASVIIMAINLTATTGASILCDRIGRRPLLIGGLLTMSLSLTALSYIETLMKCCHITDSSPAQYSFVFFTIAIYIYGFGVGIGVNFWVVCNEVLPTKIYQEAFAAVNCLKWIFLIFVTLFFPIVEKHIGRLVFLPFALVSCLAAIFFHISLPETKGLSKHQIEKLFLA